MIPTISSSSDLISAISPLIVREPTACVTSSPNSKVPDPVPKFIVVLLANLVSNESISATPVSISSLEYSNNSQLNLNVGIF